MEAKSQNTSESEILKYKQKPLFMQLTHMLFSNLAVVTAICTATGALMLRFYLEDIGLPSLFQNCLNSPGSLLAIMFGFGVFFVSIWGMLLFSPLCISWLLLSFRQKFEVVTNSSEKMSWWFWRSMPSVTCLFFVLVLLSTNLDCVRNSLLHFKINQTLVLLLATTITSGFLFFMTFYGKYKIESTKKQKKFYMALAWFGVIYIAQVINIFPFLIFIKVITESAQPEPLQWLLLIAAFMIYGIFTGITIDLLEFADKDDEKLKNARMIVCFIWFCLAVLCTSVAPQLFIAGASRFGGVLEKESAAQWYKIDKEAFLALTPNISIWPDKYRQPEFLYGFVIFQLGDTKVLCQPGKKSNTNAQENCFIFRASDLRPIGRPSLPEYMKAYSNDIKQ